MVGGWIKSQKVAPRAGAWIETPPFLLLLTTEARRAPRGRVD